MRVTAAWAASLSPASTSKSILFRMLSISVMAVSMRRSSARVCLRAFRRYAAESARAGGYFLAEFVSFGLEHRLRLRRGFRDEHLDIFRLRIGGRIGNHPGRRQLAVKKGRFADVSLINTDHQMAQIQAAKNRNEIECGNQEIDELHSRPRLLAAFLWCLLQPRAPARFSKH